MNLTPLRRAGVAIAAAGLALLSSVASAQVTVTVTPSVAPNFFGSPSYDAWASNAITALRTGVVTVGTPGTPGYYQALANGSSINSNVNISTNFASWYGNATPATAFGPAFANELGNRLHWGVAIVSTGNRISLDGLDFMLTSSDGALNYGNDPFTSADVYSPNRIGVIFGTGGNPDTIINSGSASQLVDAIYYVGVGNAYTALLSDPGITNQDRIDIVASQIGGTFGASYSIQLRDALGNAIPGSFSLSSATLNVVTVPEPTTYLAGALLAGAVTWHQRRRFVAPRRRVEAAA